MFLSTSKTLPEQPSEISSMTLKSPNRVFFDISNAVLTRPNETWYFKGSEITQIKVSQFTTNPNVVRVVFYHTDKFNPKSINVINIMGNYLFKYGDIVLNQGNFFESYRSAHFENSDYLEKMVYIPASEVAKNEKELSISQANLQNVQKAFLHKCVR